jgi:hypothetical protein
MGKVMAGVYPNPSFVSLDFALDFARIYARGPGRSPTVAPAADLLEGASLWSRLTS